MFQHGFTEYIYRVVFNQLGANCKGSAETCKRESLLTRLFVVTNHSQWNEMTVTLTNLSAQASPELMNTVSLVVSEDSIVIVTIFSVLVAQWLVAWFPFTNLD